VQWLATFLEDAAQTYLDDIMKTGLHQSYNQEGAERIGLA
jgi:hypothetical protein